ncbi:probable glycosyltransferase At5g03795 [Rhodamnia argentea]|uniref:Probable glycosyltransferase At5g03795 n=1 Tax=Rhodamnia argentea TaxID=178133 RepID=A0ABM3HPQ2_9MYRT|nr:probable glycosyltransferase At5g03795 [Rhodamnia argentea]
MVPFVAVAGLVLVAAPWKSLAGDSASEYSWSWSSSRFYSSPTRAPTMDATLQVPVLHAEAGDGRSGRRASAEGSLAPDPPPVVVGVQKKERAVADDFAATEPSAPPPLANASKEGTSDFPISVAGHVPALNESYGFVEKARRERVFTDLERLEAGLRRARAGIREAKIENLAKDPDYVPVGPMYRNAYAFHRSYLEMEKLFKIFIYEEGDPPVFHNGPCRSIYAMEGNFIHMAEINKQFRTRDPRKAHVFFLPFSVVMIVQFVYVRDSHDFGPIKRTVIDYINVLASKYPYWNRSSGADHFMLACHDWGPETSLAVPQLRRNSIRVLCNANTSEGFDPSKDVSFPEVNLHTGGIHGLIGGPSPSHRPILAFFAGGVHGPIRPILLQHWENKDDDVKVHRYLPRGVSYYDMMRKSKFCICPSGYEVASPRVVEAIYTGCVPVLISDHYVPPFNDILNWRSFSVEVPVREIPNLKRILGSISSRQYIRMQRRVVQVRRHFEVHSPPKRYDVFHMILHSVWLRRLNVRLSDSQ